MKPALEVIVPPCPECGVLPTDISHEYGTGEAVPPWDVDSDIRVIAPDWIKSSALVPCGHAVTGYTMGADGAVDGWLTE